MEESFDKRERNMSKGKRGLKNKNITKMRGVVYLSFFNIRVIVL